ncbi:extracellular solute-binding protein [Providencia rettgeri]|nr:extracellular solute-binding protein [Providencia rettgeri]EJD6600312.1 extracellular solute-binding protein [Providencia rettgeri]
MATMRDICRIAGVSHGTVSNVLNGRGNVSVEKMEAVLNAAKALGYNVNTQAQLLRANTNIKIAIVLPHLISEKYTILFNAIRQTIEDSSDLPFDVFLTDDLQSKELKILQKIASGGYQSVITVSCLNDASVYFDTLQIPPENVAFVYRKPQNAKVYFSLDYADAAQAIANQIAKDACERIGIFAESSYYLNSEEFVREVRLSLQKDVPNIEVVVCYSSDLESYNTAFDFFANNQKFDAIITQDLERTRYITQASFFGSAKQVPRIYSLTGSTPPMVSGVYCIPMNYAQLGLDVAARLFKNEGTKFEQEQQISSPFARVYTSEARDGERTRVDTLNLLTIPSPSTDALQKLLPHFFAQTGVHVNISVRPFGEIFNILNTIEEHPFYDLLRIDVAFFPWFAKKTLVPLNSVGGGLTDLQSKYTEQKQSRFCLVNDMAYAMPFDASVQLMFYRKDLFEDPITKRMYFESTGKELKVPSTFEEYDRISRFFYTHREAGNENKPYGSSSTTGSAGIISSEYLLRYYAAGGCLFGSGTEPSLSPLIAEKVLTDYMNQLSYTDRINSEWWGESIKRFESGDLAMNIAYMNLFNDVAHSPMSNNIGYAPVPGGKPQIGGGVLGMSRYSKKTELVELFYRWLYSDVIQDHILMLGGNTIQRNYIYMHEVRQRYPWLSLSYNEIETGVRESTMPNGEAFNLRQAENIIGRGVIDALDGLMTIQETIQKINLGLKNL